MSKARMIKKLEKLSVDLSRVRIFRIVTGITSFFGFMLTIGAVGVEDLYVIENVVSKYSFTELLIQEIIGIVIFALFAWLSSRLNRFEENIEHRIYILEERLLEEVYNIEELI